MPTSMIATISSEVATGRRMKMRDGLTRIFRCAVSLVSPSALAVRALLIDRGARLRRCRRGGRRRRPLPRRLRCGRRRIARHPNLGAILQAIGAVDDDNLARLQPLRDNDALLITRPEH